MGSDDIEAFANIALSGDLSGQGNTFDRGLAADYLRLIRNSDIRMRVSSRRKVFNRHRLHRDSSFTTMVRQAFSVVRTGW